MKNEKVLWVAIIGLMICLLGLGAIVMQQQSELSRLVDSSRQPVQTVPSAPAPTPTPIPTLPSSPDSATPTMATTTPSTLSIKWHAAAKIASLSLFTPTADNAEMSQDYYSIGTVTSGTHVGATIIKVYRNDNDGEGSFPVVYRLLQDSSGLYFLPNYSTAPDAIFDQSKVMYEDDDIPDLDLPDQISLRGQTFIAQKSGLTDDSLASFFAWNQASATQTLFASSTEFGPIYVYAGSNDETFYAELKDGTPISLTLNNPFLDALNPSSVTTTTVNAVAQLDGKTNTTNYILDYGTGNNFASCEEGPYVDVVTSTKIGMADLVAVGQTNTGEKLYGLKDPNSPLIKAYRADLDLLNKDMDRVANEPPLTMSKYPILYWQDPFGRLIRLVDPQFMEACGGKPVIYLYPTHTTNVQVEVAPQGGISKSEPAYDNGWSVRAEPDGTLSIGTKTYPSLFWEGGLGSYTIPTRGFVVARSEIHSFLSRSLAKLSLKSNEISDFEAFWEPRLNASKAPYEFITFSDANVMNVVAPLTITPKPDNVIRILMDAKPLDQPISVEPLVLNPHARTGFTAVEWGGVLHR